MKAWHCIHHGTSRQTSVTILHRLSDFTCSGEIPQPSIQSQWLLVSNAVVNSLLCVSPLYSRNGSFSSIDTFLISLYQRNYSILFLHIGQTEDSGVWVIYPKVTWVQWVGNYIKRNSFQLILWTLYELPNLSVQPHGSLFFCVQSMTQILRKLD